MSERRRIVFKKGFELDGKKYGWMNGQLFHIYQDKDGFLTPGKVKSTTMERKGFRYTLGKVKMSIPELTGITTDVNYVCITRKPEDWFYPVFSDRVGSASGRLLYGI